MLTRHLAPPGSALTMPLTPAAHIQPDLTFSDDQYESFTYNKWFEWHTGLSLDEAITLGVATRNHSTEWKTTRSSDGTWHLSHRSTS